ncbi:MAG: DUF2867 domain-containing protein [Polyangiaceae bacterium]
MQTRAAPVAPGEFRRLNLRAHDLLRDVPLHDAWAVDLPTRESGLTLADVHAVERAGGTKLPGGALTRLLFGLRLAIGKVFHWDGGPSSRDLPASSYAHRLSADDVQRSRLPAGTPDGPFRVLYAFDGESVAEIINATVHAFLCAALVPTEGGYRLYWGVYVKPVNRWTSTYMALIAPFRRYIVYPSILGGLRREWIRRHGVAA